MKTKQISAQALLEEGQQLYAAQQFRQAMEIMTRLEALPEADATIRMKALNCKGLIYSQLSDHVLAEHTMLQSLALARQTGDLRAMYIRYDNLAAIYLNLKEHQKAIAALQQSIELKEKSGNQSDIPRSLIQIASLQFAIDHNEAGMKTLRQASSMLRRAGIRDMDHMIYFNTAVQYKREGKYEAAIRTYARCVTTAIAHHDYLTAVRASNNQGDICMTTGQWARARNKFKQCMDLAQKASMPLLVATSRLQLAHIALKMDNVALCRRLYDEVAGPIADSKDALSQRDLAELSVMLHEAEGNYPAALEASRQYIRYYKVFYDNEMSRTILDMQGKYDAEKAERELQRANLRQVESELKALRAQMDPHFIFNALSSMRREMLEGNIDNADRYLVRFSRLLRMILDTTRQPMVRLSDNIELLHLYIQIENSRQGNRFDYTITTRGLDPTAISLPGLILQPLAENAIVHGLNPRKKGRGKLNIEFSRSRGALRIRVTDNGVGRQPGKAKDENHTSHAMNIIRDTLSLMWQDKGPKDFLTIRDLKTNNNIGKGTEVTVLVPLTA